MLHTPLGTYWSWDRARTFNPSIDFYRGTTSCELVFRGVSIFPWAGRCWEFSINLSGRLKCGKCEQYQLCQHCCSADRFNTTCRSRARHTAHTHTHTHIHTHTVIVHTRRHNTHTYNLWIDDDRIVARPATDLMILFDNRQVNIIYSPSIWQIMQSYLNADLMTWWSTKNLIERYQR